YNLGISYDLGNALHSLGLCDYAAVAYRAALRLAPELTRLHTYLGYALLSQGAATEAMQAFRDGIAAHPGEPVNHFGLAEVHAALLDLPASITAIEQALRCIAARGALVAPERETPARKYPVAMYPDALRAVVQR